MSNVLVDMTGTKCRRCNVGQYEAPSIHEDAILECDNCNHHVPHWCPTTPENCEHVWEWDGQTMMQNRWYCNKCGSTKLV